jgi:hypothetical protein
MCGADDRSANAMRQAGAMSADRGSATEPVVRWRTDWRRAHGGLYILPGMAILVSILRLFDDFTPPLLLTGLLGILSIVVNRCGGRAVKPWQVFALLPLAVALAFLAFWVSGLG